MVLQICFVPSRELPDRMEECASAREHRKTKTLLQEVSCADQAGQDDECEDAQDLSHVAPEEQCAGLDTYPTVVLAVLACVYGVIYDRPTVEGQTV